MPLPMDSNSNNDREKNLMIDMLFSFVVFDCKVSGKRRIDDKTNEEQNSNNVESLVLLKVLSHRAAYVSRYRLSCLFVFLRSKDKRL